MSRGEHRDLEQHSTDDTHHKSINQYERVAECVVFCCRATAPSYEAALRQGWQQLEADGYDSKPCLWRCPKHATTNHEEER
jgi:hypothetical protein